MDVLGIIGGHVIDPLNGIDHPNWDLWIEDGRFVTSPSRSPTQLIDAHGYVVMPAGVDIHCHIAGPKVNAGRLFRPEDYRGAGESARFRGGRSGVLGTVPSSFTTGYRYAGLGYSTAFDAAIAPFGARQTLCEFEDIPIIDKGFFVLVGNHHYIMEQIRANQPELVHHFLAWLMNSTGAYGLKIVNPGGVERWKQGQGSISSLDDIVPGFEVTPRAILRELAMAADTWNLPHPVHVHCNNLGLPGNWTTTLDTMKAVDGFRAHLTHIQFHSYGGDPNQPAGMTSQVDPLVDYFNDHPQLTVDVGQVLFGNATAMTADSAVGEFLHKLNGRKWINHDAGLETGCGVVPIEYKDKNFVHALQWAIGLEWMLKAKDLWRIALSTDHPNGGSFLAYPQIIALLMDRGLRNDTLKTLPEAVRERCGLADLTREFTLSDIAIVTRAAPAKMLGLHNKGHFGPGADGDVTIYAPNDDKVKMFSLPRYFIKQGKLVLDDGDFYPSQASANGSLLRTRREHDLDSEKHIEKWWNQHSSVKFSNFPVL